MISTNFLISSINGVCIESVIEKLKICECSRLIGMNAVCMKLGRKIDTCAV